MIAMKDATSAMHMGIGMSSCLNKRPYTTAFLPSLLADMVYSYSAELCCDL